MAEMTKNWVSRMINRHAETVLEIEKVKNILLMQVIIQRLIK